MSFIDTLVGGHEGGLAHEGLTPVQKVTLRTVVVGLLYYGLCAVEGMMMRAHQVQPLFDDEHFFAVMTAHPIIGIFGSTYLVVFGAFVFLVPYLMKKPLYSVKVANATWLLIAGGTLLSWSAAFLWSYAPWTSPSTRPSAE